MKIIKRIAVFLIMFWSVGFLLTLSLQTFARSLLNIGFEPITVPAQIELPAGGMLNVYLASRDTVPDVEKLVPQVLIEGSVPDKLRVETFSLPLSVAEPEPLFAHGLYSLTAKEAQRVSISWKNPQEGYFIATSKSLLISTVTLFSLILFSVLGASLLYYLFGARVLQRLDIRGRVAAASGDTDNAAQPEK